MSENQRLDYYELGDTLVRAQVAADAADCHGLLTGLVCAAGLHGSESRAKLPMTYPPAVDPFNPQQD